jgi:hemerythrin superfamily protein
MGTTPNNRDEEDDMDVTQMLEQDHRTVEGLFSEFEANGDETTIEAICNELEVHASIEEELVYPRLAKIDAGLEKHAEEEHGEMKSLIAQLRSGSGNTAALVDQLKSTVQDHVEEEESQAFPQLRERLGDELDSIGQTAQQRKQELTAQQ